VTARRFLAELPESGLRAATVEDVRDVLSSMSAGLSEASARQYVRGTRWSLRLLEDLAALLG
jgi:hypothetical protein